MLGDSNVTVATGNSRHYQPPRRKKRRHRRKSSNLLFSTFFFALLLLLHPPPYSSFLSLSLSLFSCPPLPLPLCTEVSVCWADTTSRREWTGAVFHPKKKDERGGRRWPEARKKADAPTTPTYLRYPLSCPSFSPFSSCFLTPSPLSPPSSPPSGYFRTGSEWVGCVWVVATLLAEKRGGPFELTRDLLYLYARIRIRETFRSKTSPNNDFPFRHVSFEGSLRV